MEFKRKVRDDRSGVSTLLIAVVIIVIVVVAAAAAYVVLSGDEKETLAPGTVIKYDRTINGKESGILEETLIGQSADEYFFMVKGVVGGTATTEYTATSKKSPENAELMGTTELDTKDGLKTLQIWEYTTTSIAGPFDVTVYVDPEIGVSYKEEMTGVVLGEEYTEVRILTAFEPVWQKSYKESKAIGKTYEYAFFVGGVPIPIKIECVADCLDDQYGIMYDFTLIQSDLKLYYLSDNIQGLPTDAVNTGETAPLTTIDGEVSAEIFTDPYGVLTLYYEPDTHIIYRIIILEVNFDLTKKPK